MSAVAFGFPGRALRSQAMERSGATSGKAGLKAGLAPAPEAKAEPEDEQKGEPSRSLEPELELHFHVRVGGDGDAGVLEVLNGVMPENLSTSLQITDRHRIVNSGHVVTARWRLKARAVTAVGCSG